MTLRNGRSGNGGAVGISGYSLALSQCALIGNTATVSGGALFASGVTVNVTNCTFAGNVAPSGAGIDLSQTLISISNSLMHGNVAVGSGGAISARSNSRLTMQRSSLSENTAGEKGGGLFASDGGVANLNSCVLWHNDGSSGAQVYIATGASLLVSYCDLEGGAAQVGKDTQATLTWLEGNLAVDPVFSSPSGPDQDPSTWFDNDFHLSVVSPCRDMGDPQFVPEFLESDIDGQPRRQADRVDIGADESPRSGDLDGDGDVDSDDQTALATCATAPGVWYGVPALGPDCGLPLDGQGFLSADIDGDRDVDQVDFAVVQAMFTGALIPADLDRDFDVDQVDVQIMLACWTGSQVIQNDPTCQAADQDRDGDVDQTDFGLLQRCQSGDGVPADPRCGR